MKLWTAAAAGLLALGGAQEKSTVKDLAWLAGRWEGPSSGGVFEEHWMAPVGGVMLGMGRMVRGEKMVFSEFIRIVETKDGIEYRVIPEGQPEAAFKLTTRSAEEAIFENPDHDFPQKIGYRKEKDGIYAWIEGTQGGKAAKMEFRLKPKK
jgi:hypothetical protein